MTSPTPPGCMKSYWGIPPDMNGGSAEKWINVSERVYLLCIDNPYIDLTSQVLLSWGQVDPAPNESKWFICMWDERIANGDWYPGGVILQQGQRFVFPPGVYPR